jgi:bifunctional non-homologous end joining protein LigD
MLPDYGIMIHVFDCLMIDGSFVMGLPLTHRLESMQMLVTLLGPPLTWSPPVTQPGMLMTKIKAWGGEGLMAKRAASRYIPGKRVSWWLKYKFTHNLTCIAYGYTETDAPDRPFGALLLALMDDDGVVHPIGQVGSGMSESMMKDLQAVLWLGGFPLVKVTCLARTANGLREPVFVRVLDSVKPAEAKLSQLDALPVT